VYALVVGKNGPKLKETTFETSAPGAKGTARRTGVVMGGLPSGQFRFMFTAAPISKLVDVLANSLERPVQDETGLTAKYDFALDCAPEANIRGGIDSTSLVAAVQEQLGLKLASKKAVVDYLVVDHFEKTPTEN
jgi:uncharacterized protein (TIGR03435 family)